MCQWDYSLHLMGGRHQQRAPSNSVDLGLRPFREFSAPPSALQSSLIHVTLRFSSQGMPNKAACVDLKVVQRRFDCPQWGGWDPLLHSHTDPQIEKFLPTCPWLDDPCT